MTITNEQRIARRKHVGSSDIAAVLGISRYATPYDLWLEKTGRLEELPGNPAIDLGNALEPVVIDMARQEIGDIETGMETIVRADLDLAANLDARTVQDGYPVEAKTGGLTGPLDRAWGDFWTDAIPEAYILQTHGQMLCTGKDWAYVPALLGGRGFGIYRVSFSLEIGDMVVAAAQAFMKFVRSDTPPDSSLPTLEAIRRVKRKAGKTIKIPAGPIADWQDAKQHLKEAEEREEEAKRVVAALAIDADVIESTDGVVTITRQSRTTIDRDKLKKEHPDLEAKYRKTSNFPVFRIK